MVRTKKYNKVLKICIGVLCSVVSLSVTCQEQDSAGHRRWHPHDAGYDYPGPRARRMIGGNATFFTVGFTSSADNQLNAEIGRSLINTSDWSYYARTIGIGYMHQYGKAQDNYCKLFHDYSTTLFIAGVIGRLEALSNAAFRKYYVRPLLGITIGPSPYVHIDLLYSYGILLNGTDNMLKGGLVIVVKAMMRDKKKHTCWPGLFNVHE